MEEDSGVKAPVTRLRRRLSVEQSDDGKSPGPATPTKKRGGRLAAKPQLELIDENTVNNTPTKRSTRKTSVKDVVETAEEKAVTPSRRSTRIKSNTSLVSESAQSYDSPRAKRAARRTSLVGSDSESSVTPIRQTRRTRKDSTSSIEKLEVTLSGKPQITEVIIEEENMSVKSDDTVRSADITSIRKSPRLKEKKDRKSIDKPSEDVVADNNENSAEGHLKVSKQNEKDRISLDQTGIVNNSISVDITSEDQLNVSKSNRKKERQSLEQISAEITAEINVSKHSEKNESIVSSSDDVVVSKENSTEEQLNSTNKQTMEIENLNKSGNSIVIDSNIKRKRNSSAKEINPEELANVSTNYLKPETNSSIENDTTKDNHLDSSLLLIKDLDKKPKKKLSILNKTTSALKNDCNFESKRQRTKSWTVTSLVQENEGLFFSDDENTKKRLKKRSSKDFKGQLNHTGSGDNENIKGPQITDKISLPFKPRKSVTSQEMLSPNNSLSIDNKPPTTETISPQGNKENIISHDTESANESCIKFFEKAPTAVLKSTVYFEDSDADSKEKESSIMPVDGEDQCVPVVDKQLVADSKPEKTDEVSSSLNQKNDVDNSCEPMDIDETMPNDVSLTDYIEPKVNKSMANIKEDNSCSPTNNKSFNNTSNKSKRKSSLCNTQNLEKSETENKSTLILSQLKDVSSTEHNESKSPKPSNEILSKSVNGKDKNKKSLSQDYSTSTPLQQKKFQKLGMQINSSIIDSSSIDKKTDKLQNNSKKDISKLSKASESSSEDESDSEDEENSSNDKNQYLDDEAEEASDDYESGDSRDEEERQYEAENEILERGETLDSEDEDTDDTDYEKDSFVVSSDEEDNELLSGSGDDLSMSDKELSFSKKSKKKFDERKQKEQKKASREMYEARHKLDDSDVVPKLKKNKKRQQIESSEESDEEVVAPVKKNKHLRLDSTNDDDVDKANISLTKKKSKSKRLSESVCENNTIPEQEISTINDENVPQHDDPLSVQVKLEPKTPMKDLNISTVQINENIEEVQIDNNISIMKSNDGTDPLQATMLNEDDSSMSENEEIINNYDSILNELNNANKTKTIKSLDMSLNLNKKTKQSVKEPIIEQLNLTKTKNKKTGKKDSAKINRTPDKGTVNTIADTESTSDSIDLKLLFSEESNDCDNTNDTTGNNMIVEAEAEDFIPLKRTPGKTNILAGKDNASPANKLNESAKKKNKKRKSHGADVVENNEGNDDIQIVIDTQGAYANVNKSLNISLSNSMKKKKNRSSVSFQEDKGNSTIAQVTTSDADDAPEEVTYKSTKKKSKKSSETHAEAEMPASQDDIEESVNVSSHSNSAKKKPKRVSESEIDQGRSVDLNVSTTSSKKAKSINVSINLEENGQEKPLNVSLKPASEKKKKKRVSETIVDEGIETLPQMDLTLNQSMGSAKKKKQKTTPNISLVEEANSSVNKSLSSGSAKKGKSKEMSQISEPTSEPVQGILEETSNKTKKRKRNSSANEVLDTKEGTDDILNSTEAKESLPSNRQKKRKILQNEETQNKEDIVTHDGIQKKKNKKRKQRDDDDENAVSKIFKENSFEKIHITRLPTSVLNQLEDKPSKEILKSKKSSLVSTTAFVVEETRRLRNKPSKFLEESVYMNETHVEKKQSGNIKKPKVLPFMPTAVTSESGFTTNFKINVIPQEIKFVAQTKNVVNFKNEYLYGKKIKRLGTYETYKKHRSAKMSKF